MVNNEGRQEKKPPLESNTFHIRAEVGKKTKIAIITDLHDRTYSRIIQSFEVERPDLICIVGDLISWHSIKKENMTLARYLQIVFKHEIFVEECGHLYSSQYSYDFLKRCVEISPTFYSLGNHEKYFDQTDMEYVKNAGAVLLDNSFIQYDDIWIGGLSSAVVGKIKNTRMNHDGRLAIKTDVKCNSVSDEDLLWLKDFELCKGFKIVMCHHPEYYDPYLKNRNINLTISGHAHGGQIRIGNQGLYAPGQGLFPKYVSGLYNNKLLVSRGIANVSRFVPRINNKREMIYIDLIPAKS